MTPSPQQQSVLDWAANPTPTHPVAAVVAVAGAGKTTTLIQAMSVFHSSQAPAHMVFLAYNKRIADELTTRISDIPGATASTFHSYGLAMLRRIRRDTKIAKPSKDPRETGWYKDVRCCELAKVPFVWQQAVKSAYSFVRQAGWLTTQTGDFAALMDHYNVLTSIPVGGAVAELEGYTSLVLKCGLDLWSNDAIIDYEDMIWLPALHLPNHAIPRPDVLLVDECQDLNGSRIALCKRLLSPTRNPDARAIFVGDPYQAIYGFAGAQSDAMDIITREFDALPLPLTVTYRCPKAVVEVARRYVPHITAADTAPDGRVDFIDEKQNRHWVNQITPGSAILCRNNTPLVNLFFRLMRAGKPAVIEGRDIGAQLLNLVRRVAGKTTPTIDEFLTKLRDYTVRQVERLIDEKRESSAGILEDTSGAVAIIAQQSASVDDLMVRITSMFGDSDYEGPHARNRLIVLSSGHRSKGLEWDNVYWYGANLYQPSKWAKKDWERRQESNLSYVMATRAKSRLVIVDAEPVKRRDDDDN